LKERRTVTFATPCTAEETINTQLKLQTYSTANTGSGKDGVSCNL
jgi:hypothetical protein